jgi:hypothetical protein
MTSHGNSLSESSIRLERKETLIILSVQLIEWRPIQIVAFKS